MSPAQAQKARGVDDSPYLEQFRDALADRPVLVTGAGGLIGSAMCGALAGLGAHVTGSGRSKASPSAIGVARWIKADLTRPDEVQALLKKSKPDLVFNLAGSLRGERSVAAIAPTLTSNLIATINLLVASQAIGASRIVNTGSLQEPTQAEEVPCSPYATSKWAGNAYARMFNDLFGLEAVIVRLFMVYGPGQNDHTKLIPYVTHRYLKGERPRLTSGEYQADWIYVDDAVEGLIGAACVPEAKGGTFELGTGRLTSVRYVTKEIKHILGSPVDPEFGAKSDRRREVVRLPELRSSRKVLGWSATTSLSDGLRKTVLSFRDAFNKTRDGIMTIGVMLWSRGSGDQPLVENVAAFF